MNFISPYIYPGLPGSEESTALKLERRFGKVINVVREVTGLCEEEILNRTRPRDIVHARQLLFYALRKKYNHSWSEIGRKTGYDHTTIIHNYNTVSDYLSYDTETQNDIKLLFQKLNLVL